MTRDSVSDSRRRVELIVAGCRQKQRPTHFFGVKASNETVRNNFERFKVSIHFFFEFNFFLFTNLLLLFFQKEIMEGQPIHGLTENMFTKTGRLHITIAMLYLMDDIDRTKACDLLDKFVHTIIQYVR